MYSFSYRTKIEQKKNKRRTIIYTFLTILSIFLILKFGIPLIIKFVSFLYDIRQSTEVINVSDTTPPPPPKIEELPLFTNNENIDIKGNTEAGSKIIINFNGKDNEVLSDNNGNFIKTFNLEDEENYIYLISIDSSGNSSHKSDTYKIYLDKIPPKLTLIKPTNNSEFYGSKQRQVIIEGNTEESASIQVNNRTVIVDSNGNFYFTTTLSEGDNNFTVKAQDQAGNISETSLKLIFSQ